MSQSAYYVENYDQPKVNEAVRKIMVDQGFDKIDFKGKKIVIKPNLIMAVAPERVATTHPTVVRGVCEYLREKGADDITLAESSGGLYNAEYMGNAYRVSGMKGLTDVLRLNDDFSAETVVCPDGYRNHTFHLITPIVHADIIINICKLKTHSMTGFSGGIKNLFGTIPGLEKPQMHYMFPDLKDFSNMLVELSTVVNPALTIIDAIDCMEGNGPTGGTCHSLHMLLGSTNMYEQDYFAATLMGIDPMSIEMIKNAAQKGYFKPEEINEAAITGDPLLKDLTPFKLPDTIDINFSSKVPKFLQKPFLFIMNKIFKSYPALNTDKCVGCGKCAESCPQKLITIKNRKAHFKKNGCISCFCCQEMCPMKAIYVKKRL